MLKKLSIYALIAGAMPLGGIALADNPPTVPVSVTLTIPNGANADAAYQDHTYTFYYCTTSGCNGTLTPIGQPLYENINGSIMGNTHPSIDLSSSISILYAEVVVSAGLPGVKETTDISGTYISNQPFSVASGSLPITFDPLHSPTWTIVK